MVVQIRCLKIKLTNIIKNNVQQHRKTGKHRCYACDTKKKDTTDDKKGNK